MCGSVSLEFFWREIHASDGNVSSLLNTDIENSSILNLVIYLNRLKNVLPMVSWRPHYGSILRAQSKKNIRSCSMHFAIRFLVRKSRFVLFTNRFPKQDTENIKIKPEMRKIHSENKCDSHIVGVHDDIGLSCICVFAMNVASGAQHDRYCIWTNINQSIFVALIQLNVLSLMHTRYAISPHGAPVFTFLILFVRKSVKIQTSLHIYNNPNTLAVTRLIKRNFSFDQNQWIVSRQSLIQLIHLGNLIPLCRRNEVDEPFPLQCISSSH